MHIVMNTSFAWFAVAGLCLAAQGCGCRDAEPARCGNATSLPAIPAAAAAFAGHRYLVIDERVSWHAAKARCETLGGHLACIANAAEQRFVADLAQGRYLFLGATDEKEEDRFVWVDGSPFTYTCWLDGQPNNYGGQENYLATYDEGAWVDVAVEGEEFWMPTGFCCEWDRP